MYKMLDTPLRRSWHKKVRLRSNWGKMLFRNVNWGAVPTRSCHPKYCLICAVDINNLVLRPFDDLTTICNVKSRVILEVNHCHMVKPLPHNTPEVSIGVRSVFHAKLQAPSMASVGPPISLINSIHGLLSCWASTIHHPPCPVRDLRGRRMKQEGKGEVSRAWWWWEVQNSRHSACLQTEWEESHTS